MNKEAKIYEYLKTKFPDEYEEYYDAQFWSPSLRRVILKNIAKERVTEKKCVFITIQDWKKSDSDFENLKDFCVRIQYLFTDLIWIIESGKDANKPHYHIHLFGKAINSKKCKNKMNIEWYKKFGTNIHPKGTDFYKLSQHRDCVGMPPYNQWVEEKLDYFKNELKGEHENYRDLTLEGGIGAIGTFTSIIES